MLLDLGPQESLRGQRLILEISRSYVAGLEKERGRSPLVQSPPGLAVSPPPQGGSQTDAGRAPQATP